MGIQKPDFCFVFIMEKNNCTKNQLLIKNYFFPGTDFCYEKSRGHCLVLYRMRR